MVLQFPSTIVKTTRIKRKSRFFSRIPRVKASLGACVAKKEDRLYHTENRGTSSYGVID